MASLSKILDFILNNIYLRFLFIMAVSLVLAWTARMILRKVLKPLARKTRTKVDDLIIKSLTTVLFYLVIVLGFKIGFRDFPSNSTLLNSLVDSMLVVIVSILVLRMVNNLAKHWQDVWASQTESTADDRLIPLAEKLVKAVVVILAVIFVLDAWNVDISPLLATAGIAGLAISFAVRDSLVNILGGLQLVLDKTFKVGDKVELDSGEMGVILDIGLRSTQLQTYDNEIIFIPNGSLANSKIKNISEPDLTQRVNVGFGVEYGTDPEQVRNVVLEAVGKIDTVLESPAPVVHFTSLSDSSLDFIARVWVKNYTEAYGTQLKVREAIYRALNTAGIGIPFPTRLVYNKPAE